MSTKSAGAVPKASKKARHLRYASPPSPPSSNEDGDDESSEEGNVDDNVEATVSTDEEVVIEESPESNVIGEADGIPMDCNDPMLDKSSKMVAPKDPKEGCMNCVHRIKLKTFKNNALERGDHIRVKGNSRLGFLFHHHAIVSKVTVDEFDYTLAEIEVIDIPGKTKPIKIHGHLLQGESKWKCTDIEKIDYCTPKFDRAKTAERAEDYEDNPPQKLTYCLCLRNCEHFATACVGGHDNIKDDKLDHSTSMQVANRIRLALHMLVGVILCIAFILNLYIFEDYVVKKEGGYFGKVDFCYCESCGRMAQTRCDWIVFAFGLFLLVVIGFILFYVGKRCRFEYRCWSRPGYLYTNKYVCNMCYVASLWEYICLVALYVIFQVVNIYIEKPLYEKIAGYNDHGIRTICVFLFIGETLFMYLMAQLFSLCVVCCKYGSDKCVYFNDRGLLWLFLEMYKCCVNKNGT